jgi:hypothetical protein
MSQNPSAFSRGSAIALVVAGFVIFLALLYVMAKGEDLESNRQDGAAHSGSNGLNGYSGLVRLLESAGYSVNRSRSPAALDTWGLLILTPPFSTNPQEFGELLEKRRHLGPTLVILPKWSTFTPPANLPGDAAKKFKRGWVVLGDARAALWAKELPQPYRFTQTLEQLDEDQAPSWSGLGEDGELPTRTIVYTADNPDHKVLLEDAAGHPLAVLVRDKGQDSEYNEEAHWTIFVAEPDLVNNYGLADPARAAAALALVGELDYVDDREITFDLTLNGFGASENLLTLAFRPPFLAATLCLIMALVIIFWRALQRFGPAAASGPAIAFGKERLIANGAGLILRARRFRLLAQPYATLSSRRLARRLGLIRHDGETIDLALAKRLPGEEPFSRRAARLEAAEKPSEILRAAQALDDLTRKLNT